jgi:predicted HTH transcriptional regulator
MAFALTLMMTGLFSVILLGTQPGTVELTLKESTIPVAKDAGLANFSLSMSSVSGGTLVLFTPNSLTNMATYGLFVIAIGTVSMDRRSEERTSSLRAQIQDWISENPGIHLRELQRCLGCAMGALQYHIYQLVDDNEITFIKNGNTKHFFESEFSDDEQVMLLTALMRNPTVQSIVSMCSSTDRITQAELSRSLSIDKSLVSYYISHLLKADVLNTIRVFGREKPLILNEWASSTIDGLGLLVN